MTEIIYFSKAERGFFHDSNKEVMESRGQWPEDAVEITQEEYDKFCGLIPSGFNLWHDGKSMCWIEDKTNNPDMQINRILFDNRMAEVNSLIEPMMDLFIMGDLSAEDSAKLKKLVKYRILLRNLDLETEKIPELP